MSPIRNVFCFWELLLSNKRKAVDPIERHRREDDATALKFEFGHELFFQSKGPGFLHVAERKRLMNAPLCVVDSIKIHHEGNAVGGLVDGEDNDLSIFDNRLGTNGVETVSDLGRVDRTFAHLAVFENSTNDLISRPIARARMHTR